MPTLPHGRPVVRFGAFEADLSSGEIHKRGHKIKLQEQPFQVLVMLLERPGTVITREELRARLWPADIFVDFDTGLNSAIKKLRDALGDSAEDPVYVETLPRRGYRFISAIEANHPSPAMVSSAASATPAVPTREQREEQAAAPQDRVEGKGKSVLRPAGIGAFALVAAATLVYLLNLGGIRQKLFGNASTPKIHSLAVLPLENLSGNPDQEYLVDGMTDELTTTVAQISSLRVISRTSAMQYKGKHKLLAEIARELRVDAVVEGSVVRFGDRVRVTAQLIDTANDKHLWAQSYERNLRDIVSLQDEIARAIANEIAIKLTPSEQTRLGSSRPINPDAYEAYLRGRYYNDRWTPEASNKAIEQFQRAIAIDSNYALAYAGLSQCYLRNMALGDRATSENLPKAEAAMMKALELDDTLAEARVLMANIRYRFYWDWTEADRQFKRGLELNRSFGDGHRQYSTYLRTAARYEEAMVEAQRAVELDPLSAGANGSLGMALGLAGRYDDALKQLRKALDLNPQYASAYWQAGFLYENMGQVPQAIAEFQKGVDLTRRDPRYLAGLGHAYALAGRRAEAQQILKELAGQAGHHYVSPYDLALVYAGLGDKRQRCWLRR